MQLYIIIIENKNNGGITMKNAIIDGIKYIGALMFLALVIGGPAIGGMVYMLNK